MKVQTLDLPGVLLLTLTVHEDARGYFLESFRAEEFARLGIRRPFVQENEAFTKEAGTIRGLHWQAAPHAQAKLLRVFSGAIWDVVADVCPTSPNYGKWVGVTLDARERASLYIPAGYAHGYVTRTENTLVTYKVDRYYAPTSERSVRWDDPTLSVRWKTEHPILSAKDAAAPLLDTVRAEDFPEDFPPIFAAN